MCGIAGVFHYGSGSVAVTDQLLVRMRDTMEHRGPDDAGVWLAPSGGVGLAHRRLSIIDLSPDGRQPMSNEDGTVWITFNGEIYNHRELRGPLERAGHRFRSRTDTEVIVHLYEEHGQRCVEHLDGMFAFAIWDEKRGELFMARDRLGVKPLYYTRQQGFLAFGSEIKALLAHPLVSRDLDLHSLGYYLTFKTTTAPHTLFSGINKLPPASTLTCARDGTLRIAQYWDVVSPETRSSRESIREASERVRDLLTGSIDRRMIADVPVGMFLSGGLDSSAVVALAASRTPHPLKTFSVGVRDLEGHNEFEFARLVSKQYGTDHHEICIGKEEVEEYLPRLVYSQDEPLSDPVCVPLFYVTRLARENDIKVVLVGEGSDEQFLGYESRISFLKHYLRCWKPLLSLPPWVLRGLNVASGPLARLGSAGKRWAHALARASRGDELFLGSVAFPDQLKSGLLTEQSARLLGESQAAARQVMEGMRCWPGADVAARMSYLDLKIRLAEILLMRVDKVTMSLGVEAREPFLDYHLAEYLMTLPLEVKLKGWDAKHVLKEAVKDLLPGEILYREKRPFAAPVNEWLRHGLDGYARSLVLGSALRDRGLFHYDAVQRMFAAHAAREADFGVPIWNLMNLSAWYDEWIAK